MLFACFKGLYIPKGWWNLVECVWEFAYGPSKKFWSLCQKIQKLGNLAYFKLNFVGPSFGLGMGMTTLGYDCTTHGMPRVWILG